VLLSRKQKNIDASVAKLQEHSKKISGLVCDVRSPQAISAVVDQVLQRFTRIDFLINGAAGNFLATLDNMSVNAFRTVIEIDAIGTFNMSKIVYEKAFKKQRQ
jgi:peroxisomal 2,4-dienoyl-CoA reductase